MSKKTYITKEIVSSMGGRESSSVELQVEIKTGKAQLVIEKTIRECYPVEDYKKVMRLHKDLTRGGGRRCYSLDDLTK